MRYGLAILLCLPLLSGCGGHKEGAAHTQTVDGITAQLIPIPDPPHVGHDTDFAVAVSQGGSPLVGAGVRLSLYYKTMSQVGPSDTAHEASPGRYEVHEMTTGMNGQWEGKITLSRVNVPDVHFRIPFEVQK